MGGIVTTVIRPLTLDDLDSVVALEAANQPAPWSEGVFRDELAAENRVPFTPSEREMSGSASGPSPAVGRASTDAMKTVSTRPASGANPARAYAARMWGHCSGTP